jgi:hypothetical protein
MAFLQTLGKWLFGSIAVVIVAVGLFLFGAGFSDGPLAIVPGGVFTSGEMVTEEPDWNFAKDIGEVEFQLMNPASSRTSWIAVADGRIFIPSGYMNSNLGKIWKQWPIDAEADGRAILRIDGKLYHRTLVRVIDDPIVPAVLSELSRKYMGGGPVPAEIVTSGSMWLFELKPRA